MTLSRKEFLTRGLMAFGRELVREAQGEAPVAGSGPAPEVFGPLLVDNRRCLAQRGGCFSCLDHCPQEAISIRLGVGIGIDPARCDGCGDCATLCPVEPKVITMQPVAESTTTATRKETDVC